MKISGIYKIQSIKKPDRIYIGSSVNVSNRWKGHLRDLKNGKHHSKKLQRHYDKYGVSDLHFSLLIGCDKDNLIPNEQFFIDSYTPYFNVRITANSNLGLKMGPSWNKGKKATEQAKINQSKSHKGQIAWNKGKKNVYSNETLEKMKTSLKGRKVWNKGKKYHFHNKRDNSVYLGRKHTPEAIIKMKIAQSNRPPMSEERKRQISLIKMGNRNMVGKKRSEETKEKIRKSLTGRKQPIELREKLSNIRKEWYKNNESKVKGTTLSPEHKSKITEGLLRHYKNKKIEKYDIVTKN